MKQLDWKSFIIGILLTTIVVFGVAATNPTFGKQWNENQKWISKSITIPKRDFLTKERLLKFRDELEGWEFVSRNEKYLIYRRPVEEWPKLPPYKKTRSLKFISYDNEELSNILP